MATTSKRIGGGLTFVGALFVAVTAALTAGGAVTRMPMYTLVAMLLMFAFAIAHGMKRYGVKMILFLVVAVFAISWSCETLGILTGFPFGRYHYTANFIGPWVGLVPLMIMPAYFGMGYLSWTIATILMEKRDTTVKGFEVVMLPLIASFVMVFWDMSMDPLNSTIGNFWVWHDGGAYFGVPLGNFAGWFLCVFTFFLAFALVLGWGSREKSEVIITQKSFWILPVLLYMTRPIEYVINVLLGKNLEIVSNDGHVWWTGDIYRSTLIVSLFTMVLISLYAMATVCRKKDA